MLQQIQPADLEACLEAVHAVGEAAASLVGFVLNRPVWELTDRDRACAEAIRLHLANLHQKAQALDSARAAWGVPAPQPGLPCGAHLTERERDVLRWLSGGKTDKDIGALLGISPRTVHKHLQRIYEKLGVECRTAAVVRAMPFLQKTP